MPLLDRIIEAVSPETALRREYARARLDLARKYDAAATGRRTGGWSTSGASANVEVAVGAQRIRNRVRDLARNSAFGAAALQKLPAKVYGPGIKPRLVVEEGAGAEGTRRKRAAESDWRAFTDNSDPEGQTDYYGQCYLACRSWFESGEVLVRLLPQPSSAGLRVPLQIEVLEADWLDSGKTGRLADGGAIIQGVEYGPTGRRRGYWLYDQHPGEQIAGLRGGYRSSFVPASDIVHMMEPQRPGQARGLSLFAPIVLKMRDLDDADEAELMRRKIAACFAAFVTRESAGPGTPLAAAGAVSTDASDRRIETLAPGMVQYLEAGDDVTLATPPNADGFVEYHTAQLYTIAAGLGLPYHSLTGNFSNFNYSSYRGAVVEFGDLRDHWLWHVIVPALGRRIWQQFAAVQAVLGRRDPAAPYEAEWSPSPLRMLDPGKEIPPRVAAIRSGLKPLSADLAEQGEDVEAILDQYRADNEAIDARGLVLDSDPRKVSGAGLTQGRPAGTQLPPTGEPGSAANEED
ncbi:MAG: phage portal protein [Alphaproteobacteria bacterium]